MTSARRGPLAAVRAFAAGASAISAERCELCGAAVAARHDHLVDGAGPRLLCACDACAVVAEPGRRVRRRVERLGVASPSAATWRALNVPVDLAFFFTTGDDATLGARYPGPAGAVEAALPGDALARLAAEIPAAATLARDVEALVVDRRRDAVYRATIDVAFELVASLRGARDVGAARDAFFADLDAEAARG